jgi:predicted transcriptional regulator YdeE
MKLVGISLQNPNIPNLEEPESESIKSINEMVERYYTEELRTKIANINNPGFPVAVYMNYKIEEFPFAPYSEAKGKYTCFFGDQVTRFENIKEGLEVLTVPAQTYAKFSSLYSNWEIIVPAFWQEIRKMDSSELGGERSYLTDVEIYDGINDVVEIYVGIKK